MREIARFAQIGHTNEKGEGDAGGMNNARGDLAAKLCAGEAKRQTDRQTVGVTLSSAGGETLDYLSSILYIC